VSQVVESRIDGLAPGDFVFNTRSPRPRNLYAAFVVTRAGSLTAWSANTGTANAAATVTAMVAVPSR